MVGSQWRDCRSCLGCRALASRRLRVRCRRLRPPRGPFRRRFRPLAVPLRCLALSLRRLLWPTRRRAPLHSRCKRLHLSVIFPHDRQTLQTVAHNVIQRPLRPRGPSTWLGPGIPPAVGHLMVGVVVRLHVLGIVRAPRGVAWRHRWLHPMSWAAVFPPS